MRQGYGRRLGVDLWPDTFIEAVPGFARPVASLFLEPFHRTARRALRGASAIIGLTEDFRDWGLRQAGRRLGPWDRVFPMGYPAATPSPLAVEAAERFWNDRGISDDGTFKICFFGSMNSGFELETVIEGARRLEEVDARCRFILCGTGERAAAFKDRARNLPSVVFPGWIGASEIWTLMRMCQVGQTPYQSSPNFVRNLPHKPAEYMSAGLPILSSLKGVLQKLLAKNACGITYHNGSTDQFVQAISQLRENPELRRKMSINAMRLFETKFTAEKVNADYVTYLEELAGSYRS